MMYAQLVSNQPIALNPALAVTFERDGQTINASYQTVMLWSDQERAAIGVYPIVDDAIPDGKITTGSALENDNGTIRRRWTLEDAPPPAVPQSITPAQAKAQLYEMGLLEDAEALVASHPYALVRLYWNSALQFDRDNAYIAALAYELGVDEQLDDLFRAAGARVF